MGEIKFWFMNINTTDGEDGYNKEEALSFCKKKEIIGLGWPVSEEVHSVKKAKDALKKKYPNKGTTVLRFLKEVDKDSYVWIFHKINRVYFLCKVESDDWFNKSKSEMPWGKHDIGWYRKAKWKEIPRNLIPAPILRNPHRGTLSRINISSGTANYILKLFDNPKIDKDIANYRIKEFLENKNANELIDLFDSYEIEDIVCNYLQSKGWRLIKSTASKSLSDFEVFFRRSDGNNNVAYVQVKSGKQEISKKNIQLYEKLIKDEEVLIYVFEQKDSKFIYPESIIQITSQDIKEYILKNLLELNPETLFKIYSQK